MEVVEFSPSSSDGEGTLTRKLLAALKSNSEGDPMVSGTIIPVKARVEITVASSGRKGLLAVLLDSGCSPGVVRKLGMRLREL